MFLKVADKTMEKLFLRVSFKGQKEKMRHEMLVIRYCVLKEEKKN